MLSRFQFFFVGCIHTELYHTNLVTVAALFSFLPKSHFGMVAKTLHDLQSTLAKLSNFNEEVVGYIDWNGGMDWNRMEWNGRRNVALLWMCPTTFKTTLLIMLLYSCT